MAASWAIQQYCDRGQHRPHGVDCRANDYAQRLRSRQYRIVIAAQLAKKYLTQLVPRSYLHINFGRTQLDPTRGGPNVSMIRPTLMTLIAPTGLTFEDFAADEPWQPRAVQVPEAQAGLIDGVTITPLIANSDSRGSLSEVLTSRDGLIEPIVHVYNVTALPGSIRAWVYHRLQFDRLAFTQGRFEIALYDIRPGSPTLNQLVVFTLGRGEPALLRIPPLVIHGICNVGGETASFINLPTRVYDPQAPDKCRLNQNDLRIPFVFNVGVK